MRFEHVTLAAPGDRMAMLHDFYGGTLGLPCEATGAALQVTLGETELEFVGAPGEPFYHFAFLVPGDRFEAALEWVRARVTLLTDSDSASAVFDFDAWSAHACYFHDPAGSIVELIAHRAIGETGASGEFSPTELICLSELGLVGAMAPMADALHGIGLEVWDGTVTGSLAFVGEQARTLILAREGRGWLPTGRPSEPHPVQAVVSAGGAAAPGGAGAVELEGGRYRVAVS